MEARPPPQAQLGLPLQLQALHARAIPRPRIRRAHRRNHRRPRPAQRRGPGPGRGADARHGGAAALAVPAGTAQRVHLPGLLPRRHRAQRRRPDVEGGPARAQGRRVRAHSGGDEGLAGEGDAEAAKGPDQALELGVSDEGWGVK